jgi:hypothetical protein
MSKRPLRVTGFARFFIVMLFVAPLAYLGASYYNGQDGIQNLRTLLKLNKKEVDTAIEPNQADAESIKVNESPSTKALIEENMKLKEELEFKKKCREGNRRNQEIANWTVTSFEIKKLDKKWDS